MPINVGILPRRSNSVCILTAPLCLRNLAHGNIERHRSMVVESNAYKLASKSIPIGSPAYSGRAMAIKTCPKSAKILQSRDSLASAKVELQTQAQSEKVEIDKAKKPT